MYYPFIIGQSLYLNPLDDTYLENYLQWFNDPEIRWFTYNVFPNTISEISEWLENIREDKSSVMLNLMLMEEDIHIGIAGLENIDWINRSANLFIMIGEKSVWEMGLGAETTQLLVKYAFDTLQLHRLEIRTFSWNKAAIEAYQSVGFEKEGLLNECIFRNGQYHNMILLARLSYDMKVHTEDI